MSIVKVGNKDVNLDDTILQFDESTINSFLTKYASLYDKFVEHHTDAQYILSKLEDRHEALIASKVVEFKEQGGSDKFAEARAKSDQEVQDLAEKVRIAKYVRERIWGYLRSMDKAHTNALQLCYNLRKEMDKIFPQHVKKTELAQKLEDIIGTD